MYYFASLEPIHCFMSSSNYYFLTCIQVSQEAGKVVWYSHLFKNFLQFVIHTVKGFSIWLDSIPLYDYTKAIYCVDHNKLENFLKRWEYQTTLPAF